METRSHACKESAKTAERLSFAPWLTRAVLTAHSKVPMAPGELGMRYDKFATETACHGPIASTPNPTSRTPETKIIPSADQMTAD